MFGDLDWPPNAQVCQHQLSFLLTYKCRTQNYDPQAKIRPCERHNSQFIFEYHLYEINYTSEKKTKKTKIQTFSLRYLGFLKN